MLLEPEPGIGGSPEDRHQDQNTRALQAGAWRCPPVIGSDRGSRRQAFPDGQRGSGRGCSRKRCVAPRLGPLASGRMGCGSTFARRRPRTRPPWRAVLKECYPVLLAPAYDAALLAKALPLMTRANPALLASGTYYLAEAADGAPVGLRRLDLRAAGRTGRPDRPGAGPYPSLRHRPRLDRPRCRPSAVRPLPGRCRGGRGVPVRSLVDPSWRRRSTAAMGFQTVERFDVAMGPEIRFPSVRMVRRTVAASG